MRLVDETRADATWWEDEGRRIGDRLDEVSAAVVIAPTPDDAAAIALGIGAVQGARRRVVVADLAGDTGSLQRLVTSDDVHGITDSFLYGVSINRIAHAVPGVANLFVLPSGTEPVVGEEIYRHDRWRRLVAGFREVGALLLLVAPAGAPAIDALAGFTDGVVAGGEVAAPRGSSLLALATAPSRVTIVSSADLATEAADADEELAEPADPAVVRRASRWVVGGAVVLGAAALAAALFLRLPSHSAASVAQAAADSAARDSLRVASAATLDSAAASVAPEALPILNPADSANATGYSVELAKFSTPLGALLRVRDELPPAAPATTFAVIPLGADGTLWYRVLAGVAATRPGADSTLSALRRMPGIGDSTAGAVVSVPLAFRLQEGVDPAAAPGLVRQYLARGVPAYALRQADGTATLYAGGFATAEQAALFTTYLRDAGVEPALTYRLGRTL